MKTILLLSFLSFGFYANSQDNYSGITNLQSAKPWEKAKKEIIKNLQNNKSPQVIQMKQFEDQGDDGVVKTPVRGKYLGTNEQGDDIYAMTPDNMPCLVPGKQFNSNMPVADEQLKGRKFVPPFEKQRRDGSQKTEE